MCAPTAWAQGHSPRRTGPALGSPNPLPPAEAWWPKLGLQRGRNQWAEPCRGGVASLPWSPSLLNSWMGGGDQRLQRGGTGGARRGGTTGAHSPSKGCWRLWLRARIPPLRSGREPDSRFLFLFLFYRGGIRAPKSLSCASATLDLSTSLRPPWAPEGRLAVASAAASPLASANAAPGGARGRGCSTGAGGRVRAGGVRCAVRVSALSPAIQPCQALRGSGFASQRPGRFPLSWTLASGPTPSSAPVPGVEGSLPDTSDPRPFHPLAGAPTRTPFSSFFPPGKVRGGLRGRNAPGLPALIRPRAERLENATFWS